MSLLQLSAIGMVLYWVPLIAYSYLMIGKQIKPGPLFYVRAVISNIWEVVIFLALLQHYQGLSFPIAALFWIGAFQAALVLLVLPKMPAQYEKKGTATTIGGWVGTLVLFGLIATAVLLTVLP